MSGSGRRATNEVRPGPKAQPVGSGRPDSKKFVKRFLLLLPAVVFADVFSARLPAVTTATRAIVVWATRLTGLGVEPGGTVQVLFHTQDRSFTYEIIQECTAITLALLLAAAMIAYPAAWQHRLAGIVIGIPLLIALNVVRLVSLAWIGIQHPSSFKIAHVGIWQAVLILAVALGWWCWARHVVHRPHAAARSRGGRPILSLLGLFILFFGVLLVFGFYGGGVAAYGRALRSLVMAPITSLWGVAFGSDADLKDFGRFMWPYAQVAAVVALFLATPTVGALERLKGALLWGLAPVVVVHMFVHAIEAVLLATGITAEYRAGRTSLTTSGHPLVDTLSLVLAVAVPVLCWYAWAKGRGVFLSMTRRYAPGLTGPRSATGVPLR